MPPGPALKLTDRAKTQFREHMNHRIDFDELFLQLNHLPDFAQWIFHPGMLFDSRRKWWTQQGLRRSAHEGIDFCLYANQRGSIRSLEPGARVPAMEQGTVVSMQKDLLGNTVFVRHDTFSPDGWPLCSIYAHVQIHAQIAPGSEVSPGDCLASVAAPDKFIAGMLPHLHLSLAWIDPARLLDSGPDWEMINSRTGLQLVDPMRFLSCSHQVKDPSPHQN